MIKGSICKLNEAWLEKDIFNTLRKQISSCRAIYQSIKDKNLQIYGYCVLKCIQ